MELRELVQEAAFRVPGLRDWLDVQRASRSEDPAGRGWDQMLGTFVVEDAFIRGDAEAAVRARRD